MKTFYSHRDEPGRGGASYLMNTYGLIHVNDPNNADVIIWNGGEDIGTSIYGQHPINNYIPYKKSARDMEEVKLFNTFSKSVKPKLLFGICRGAQLLNCLNGGSLYQDVNNHARSHPYLDLKTNEVFNITSTHHQQMIAGPSAVVVGVSNESTKKRSEHVTIEGTRAPSISQGDDMETLWYPHTSSLCMQGHPEYVPNTRYADYTWELLQSCWNEVNEVCAA